MYKLQKKWEKRKEFGIVKKLMEINLEMCARNICIHTFK